MIVLSRPPHASFLLVDPVGQKWRLEISKNMSVTHWPGRLSQWLARSDGPLSERSKMRSGPARMGILDDTSDFRLFLTSKHRNPCLQWQPNGITFHFPIFHPDNWNCVAAEVGRKLGCALPVPLQWFGCNGILCSVVVVVVVAVLVAICVRMDSQHNTTLQRMKLKTDGTCETKNKKSASLLILTWWSKVEDELRTTPVGNVSVAHFTQTEQ